MTLLIQHVASFLEEKENVKGESFVCENVHSIVIENVPLKPRILLEEDISFKHVDFKYYPCSKEAFHYLMFTSFYSLSPDIFYGFVA